MATLPRRLTQPQYNTGLNSGVDYFGRVGRGRKIELAPAPKTLVEQSVNVPGTGINESSSVDSGVSSSDGGSSTTITPQQANNMGLVAQGAGILGAATDTPELGMLGNFLGAGAAASQKQYGPLGSLAGGLMKGQPGAIVGNTIGRAISGEGLSDFLNPRSVGETLAGVFVPGYGTANFATRALTSPALGGDLSVGLGDVAEFANQGQEYLGADYGPVDNTQAYIAAQRSIEFDPVASLAGLRGENISDMPGWFQDNISRGLAYAENTGAAGIPGDPNFQGPLPSDYFAGYPMPAAAAADAGSSGQQQGAVTITGGSVVDGQGNPIGTPNSGGFLSWGTTPSFDDYSTGGGEAFTTTPTQFDPWSDGSYSYDWGGSNDSGTTTSSTDSYGSTDYGGLSGGAAYGWKDGGMVDIPGLNMHYAGGGMIGAALVPQEQGFAVGGQVGLGGQPDAQSVQRQVAMAMKNPQRLQAMLARPKQLMASGELTPDEVVTMGRVAEASMFNPDLYPQLRQFVEAQGMTPLPASYDPAVIVNIVVISRALQQETGGATPAGQVPPMAQARMETPVGMQSGGAIVGPGTGRSDSVGTVNTTTGTPVKVSNGEYVIPEHVVRAKGKDFFDSLLRKYTQV